MKRIKILMLWFLLVPMFSSIMAQIVQPLPITEQERAYHRSVYDLKKDIEFSASMAAVVDSVYPGVKFIMQASSIGQRGFIYYIKEKDTTKFYITNGELQLDCTFLNDSVFRYSVSSLLKTNVHLDLIERLGKKYFKSGFMLESDQIEVTKVSIDLNDNKDRRYRAMDSSERFINYTVNVNLPETFIFSTESGLVKTKSIYFEYTVVEGLIIGRSVTFITEDRSIIKEDYYGYRKFNLKYEKRNYKQYRELKKKDFNHSRTNFWTEVYFSSLNNLEAISIPSPDGYMVHHLTIETDHTFCDGSTKFQILGVDNSIPNPEFRIYTSSFFGGDKVLLFSSQLENSTSDSRETIDSYSPQNNGIDGFCFFEIWSNNNLIKKYDYNETFVLQRKKTDNTHNKVLHVYYAKSFFHNHPSGYSICDSYVNDAIHYYNNAWYKQVNTFNLNNGVGPSTSNDIYQLSINPFQNLSRFVFWRDYKFYGCYEFPIAQRHMGITANPKLFLEKVSYTIPLIYSDNDFLEVAIFHEFYHGMQYTFNNNMFDSESKRWLIEGQARCIQSLIGDPPIEFKSFVNGMYRQDANIYILNNLNKSLLNLSYDYSLFWRFLFENSTTSTNIADKLAIFRETCKDFNATNITDIEKHMDQKLEATLLESMDKAVAEFAKHVVFNDPEHGYWEPCPSIDYYARVPYRTINYNGTETSRKNNINSSYGIDYYLISFDASGKTLLNFNGDPNNDKISPHYDVKLYFADSPDSPIDIKIVKGVGTKEIEINTPGKLGFLAITRIDDKEELKEDYGIIISPRVPTNKINADFTGGGGKSGFTSYPTGSFLDFTDMSSGGNYDLFQWSWSFTGGSPSSSNARNPEQIYYTYPGSYPVSLTVTNTAGEHDTKTINGYINIYEPSNPNTFEALDLTTYNPNYANPYQTTFLSLWINSGTPPYQISITTDNQQTTLYNQQSSETFHQVMHSWSNSGTKGIWYQVTDANGNIGTAEETISIGFPGSHNVDFSYTWSTSYPNTLGTNTEVFFNGFAGGGFEPYYLWIWEYGYGINTGTLPLNSDGYSWEMKYDWGDDNFSGDPEYSVTFKEYDTYPVTLIVYDNSGLQKSITKLVDVSTATKCMKLDPCQMSRYNSKLGKHIIEYEFGESERVFYNAQHLFDFPWRYSISSYCANNYPYDGNYPEHYPSADNSITDTKISFINNNLSNKRESMPELYVNNPNPGSYNSNPPPLNLCNWGNTIKEDYFEKWAKHYWDWFAYSICPENTNYLKWPSAIEFIPPSSGKFIMRYEAWNRFSQPNQSAFIPSEEPNLEMYDYIDVPFYVVDCDDSEFINTTINSGLHIDQLAGRFEFANISEAIIESDAEITYQSCNEIVMNPGFSALSGSSFLAQVTTLSNDDDYFLPGMFVDSKQDFDFGMFYNCYPNPNNGIFRISHPGTLKANNLEVFNMSGQPVSFQALDFDFEVMIQINNPVTGVFFIRMLLDSGEVMYKKVIVAKF